VLQLIAKKHSKTPLSVEQNKALATMPVEELLRLPFLQPDKVMTR
jgi:hypothetical protein